MNRQIRDKWCAKLRDPNTKQTTKVLIDEYGQCCLGVLSEVAGVEINTDHIRNYDFTEWSEVEEDAPLVDENLPPTLFAQSVGLTREDMSTLANMNDGVQGTRKRTFPQIANYIEVNY
jgi:hypothetical protein